jgi:hypothetical protein
MLTAAVTLGYFAMIKAGEDNSKYSLKKVAMTAKITAYDIGFYTGRDAGSGYALGELDGTLTSMFKLAPQAIVVSLFRPYLWEVKNPLMLLSALESLFLLIVSTIIAVRLNVRLFRGMDNPTVLFTFIFSIVFAFAVGVSTFNFGTLVRYKIPMLPFFLVALFLIWDYSKRDKKVLAFESTE